jgi:hypothetical protein
MAARFVVRGWYYHRYVILDHVLKAAALAFGRLRLRKLLARTLAAAVPALAPLRWLCGLLLLAGTDKDPKLTVRLRRVFGPSPRGYLAYRFAVRLFRERNYSAATEALFGCASDTSREITASLRHADFLVLKYGYQTERLAGLVQRLGAPPLNRHLTPRQRARLLTIQLQRGGEVARLTAAGLPQFDEDSAGLYLLHRLNPDPRFHSPHSAMASRIYQQIGEGRQAFEQLIRQAPGRVCILGNAPTERGSGHGTRIDSFDVVIRMNDYCINQPADYGTKQTVWVRVANHEVSQDHSQSNQITIFSANDLEVKRSDAMTYLVPLYLGNRRYTTIPSEIFRELIGQLNSLPSTGLTILYWIYKIGGPISRTSLFGFSHFRDNPDFRAHYFENRVASQFHIHQWASEADLIKRIVRG